MYLTLLRENNKDADQPAHSRSPVSAFDTVNSENFMRISFSRKTLKDLFAMIKNS